MNRIIPIAMAVSLLLGAFARANDPVPYASIYASPGASAQVPPNLHIAKGLPRTNQVGLDAVKRIWQSYRTPAPRPQHASRPNRNPFLVLAPTRKKSR